MFRFPFALPSILIAMTIVVAGCGKQDTASAPDGTPAVDGAATSVEDPKIAEALAKLDPADQELAKKQKTCPVSGEPLGSMGMPVKVTVKGQEVLLCCKGCEAEIQENPDKYLEKLPK